MRVGPLKSTFRRRFQTAFMLLDLRGLVRSDKGKGIVKGVRYVIERRTKVNHRWSVESWLEDVKTKALALLWDKRKGNLITALVASGVKMAWTYCRHLNGTRERVVSMGRETLKWRTHKSKSTDANHTGGTSCSSDEISVMEMERRGCIIQFLSQRKLWFKP